MKKEVADKWVEALRSGKYKQGKKYLKRGEFYCCLGVLCEISGIDKFKLSLNDFDFGEVYLGRSNFLPSQIQDYAAMYCADGTNKFGDHPSLSELNDSGHSFHHIAKIIEENWQNI